MPLSITPAVRQRLVAVIFIVSSLVAAGQVAFFTLMPIVAADLSGRESAAGVPSTLGLLFRTLTTYPLGWLMGRAGRRPGLIVGLLLGVAGTALSARAVGSGAFWLFAFGAGVGGISRGAADLARYAAAEISPPDRRARVIGWIVFAGTIGALAGPLLVSPAVTLAGRMGLTPESGPFWAAALVLALSAVLTFILLRPDPLLISRLDDAATREAVAEQPPRPLKGLLELWPVRLGIAAMAIGQLVMVMIMVITPLHMDHAGHGTGSISLVILAHQLGMFGLSGGVGWLIDRLGAAAVIVAGAVLLVVASLLSPFVVSVVGLSLALFLLGLGWNLCFVAGSALLAEGLAPSEKTRVQGLSDAGSSAASALGSLGSGLLFAWGSMTLVGAVGLAFSLALIAAWVVSRNRVSPVKLGF